MTIAVHGARDTSGRLPTKRKSRGPSHVRIATSQPFWQLCEGIIAKILLSPSKNLPSSRNFSWNAAQAISFPGSLSELENQRFMVREESPLEKRKTRQAGLPGFHLYQTFERVNPSPPETIRVRYSRGRIAPVKPL
jgi:hypothetical protein